MSNLETQVVLGNAAQLAVSIVQEVLGNETSTSVEGCDLTRDVCLSMIESRIEENLNNRPVGE